MADSQRSNAERSALNVPDGRAELIDALLPFDPLAVQCNRWFTFSRRAAWPDRPYITRQKCRHASAARVVTAALYSRLFSH